MDGAPFPVGTSDPHAWADGDGEPSAAVDTAEGRHVPCPEDDCPTRFACDACLDEHLRTVHEATYVGVFGDVSTAWVTLCEGHAEFPVERITTA